MQPLHRNNSVYFHATLITTNSFTNSCPRTDRKSSRKRMRTTSPQWLWSRYHVCKSANENWDYIIKKANSLRNFIFVQAIWNNFKAYIVTRYYYLLEKYVWASCEEHMNQTYFFCIFSTMSFTSCAELIMIFLKIIDLSRLAITFTG